MYSFALNAWRMFLSRLIEIAPTMTSPLVATTEPSAQVEKPSITNVGAWSISAKHEVLELVHRLVGDDVERGDLLGALPGSMEQVELFIPGFVETTHVRGFVLVVHELSCVR